jgi:hypothetical protein
MWDARLHHQQQQQQQQQQQPHRVQGLHQLAVQMTERQLQNQAAGTSAHVSVTAV